MLRKLNLLSLFVLLLCVMVSCSNEKSVYNELEVEFKASLDTVTGASTLKAPVYMVIPRAGCGGCISTAEVFMIDCLKDPRHHRYIKFILTNFDSQKLLRARYGAFYKSNMLIIDGNNVFNANNSLKSIYPTIYFFTKEGKLIKVSQCSPNEEGTDDIKTFIAKNPDLAR